MPSFEGFSSKVFQTSRAFYATFVGCTLVPLSRCGERGRPQIAGGNPDDLARLAESAYVSSVVDNIIRVDGTPLPPPTVTVGSGGPFILSETRFEPDPWATSFDHAYAQRYGSSSARQDPGRTPKDRPNDRWESSLPKATFNYGFDAKLSQLPVSVRTRYPLELPPASPSQTSRRFLLWRAQWQRAVPRRATTHVWRA